MAVEIIEGDCVESLGRLPAASHQCCVTSPPYYGLRDYGHAGQIGLEPTPEEYIARMVGVFREVRRALRDDGTLWLNVGDSYANASSGGVANGRSSTLGPKRDGLPGNKAWRIQHGARPVPPGYKPKDLLGIPWMLAFALRADGWFLRSAIVWHKPNPMPESVRDRPTSAYEHVFLLTKRAAYFYDADAIREEHARLWAETNGGNMSPDGRHKAHDGYHERGGAYPLPNPLGRNARNVWTIATRPYSGAHFATMPPDLAERCIKAGSKPGDHVLDPFGGAGTTALVADRLGRHATLCELNPEYARLARARIHADAPLLGSVA